MFYGEDSGLVSGWCIRGETTDWCQIGVYEGDVRLVSDWYFMRETSDWCFKRETSDWCFMRETLDWCECGV